MAALTRCLTIGQRPDTRNETSGHSMSQSQWPMIVSVVECDWLMYDKRQGGPSAERQWRLWGPVHWSVRPTHKSSSRVAAYPIVGNGAPKFGDSKTTSNNTQTTATTTKRDNDDHLSARRGDQFEAIRLEGGQSEFCMKPIERPQRRTAIPKCCYITLEASGISQHRHSHSYAQWLELSHQLDMQWLNSISLQVRHHQYETNFN